MNLRELANGLTSMINPNIEATIAISNGFRRNPDGTISPVYDYLYKIPIQLQPLDSDMIQQTENVNLQGIIKSVHVNNNYYAQLRKENKGGDKIIIGNDTWLVIKNIELWPDWCRLMVKLQVDG